jgi:hypothetical protein
MHETIVNIEIWAANWKLSNSCIISIHADTPIPLYFFSTEVIQTHIMDVYPSLALFGDAEYGCLVYTAVL